MAKPVSAIEHEIRLALQKCKLTVRGLWHEMRHLIETESDRPGQLRQNGEPVSEEQLANAAGCSSKKVPLMLQRLQGVRLIELSSDGVWYSARLARIHELEESGRKRTADWRARAKSEGHKPSGRSRRRVSRDTDAGVTCASRDEGVTTAGSPSSVSLSIPLSSTPPTPANHGQPSEPGLTWALAGMPVVPESLRTPRVLAALDEWIKHRRERRPKVTPTAARNQLKRLEKWGEARAVAAIEHSIANSYQGIWEEPEQKQKGRTDGRRDHTSRKHSERGHYAEPVGSLPEF